jgi:hypothetical protein
LCSFAQKKQKAGLQKALQPANHFSAKLLEKRAAKMNKNTLIATA